MASSNTSKSPTKQKPPFVDRFKGNKVFFAIAIAVAIAIAGLVLFILSSVVATTKYYVLNTDVPARSQITQSMLTEVVTSKGGEPRNALDLVDVMSQETYAKYALNTGDILTQSNTGEKSPLTAGVPEDFTIMSISVSPNNAVAGKIAAGDYIDVVARNEAGDTSKVVLRHVLVTDAMTDPTEMAATGESTGAEASADAAAPAAATSTEDSLRVGIPTMYTVAVSLEDAAKLQVLMLDPTKVSIVLSPESYKDGVQEKGINAYRGDIFSTDAVGDSGEGTDPTFGQGDDAAEGEVAETE